jgi:hypothetical protein
MAITIDGGTNTISGLAVGGLPDGVVDGDMLASGTGGKVLQVITTEVVAATASTTSDSWADIAGMSVAITPSATSSKIFCIYQIRTDGQMHWATRMVRDSTGVGVGTVVGSRYGASAGGLHNYLDSNTQMESMNMVLDSPSSTSELTYKAQWCQAAGTLYLNRNVNNTDTGGGASTSARDAHSYSAITVFEIGA